MSTETDFAKERMEKSVENLKHEFAALRTGRPSPAVLDNIKVDYYGTATPISQVAAIKVLWNEHIGNYASGIWVLFDFIQNKIHPAL